MPIDLLSTQPTKRPPVDLLAEKSQRQPTDLLATTPARVTVKPAPEEEPLIFKVFDVLQRGQYASANLARVMIEKPIPTGTGEDPTLAVWKGLSGEEKGSFIDVLKQHNFSYPTAVGLMLDIGLDPTTYIPAGAITKPLKAIKKTGLVRKIGKLAPVEALGKAFIPGYGLPKKYYTKKLLARYALKSKELSVLDDLGELAAGLSKADRNLLSAIRQAPERISELNAFQRVKLQKFADEFEHLGREAVDKKLITKQAFDKWKNTYLPGFYPRRTKLSTGGIPPGLFEKTRKPFFAKPKKFATLEEAADWARKTGMPLPELDIAKILGVRKVEQARVLARMEFVNSTLEEFGTKVSSADIGKVQHRLAEGGMGLYLPKGAIRFYPAKTLSEKSLKELLERSAKGELIEITPDLFSKSVGITKKVPAYLMPKGIADDLNKAQKFFISDPATNSMLRFYDNIMGKWKTMATSARLPFHLRNAQSNYFLMWLGGVNPAMMPVRTKQALAIQRGAKGFIKLKSGKQMSYDALRKMANEYGVHGRGWLGADMPSFVFKEMDRMLEGTSKLSRTLKHPLAETARLSKRLGTTIEDNARVGLFVDAIAKGDAPLEASAKVRRYLFDYSELTPFEQNVMKRVAPFYTWMRKNIPLQISSVLEQPGKYAAVGKTFDAMDKKFTETAQENLLKPDYMRDMLYVKSPWKTDKNHPLYMSVDLPYGDIQRMTSLSQMISSVTPAKTILELATNIRTFPKVGMKIEYPEGKKVPAPFYVMWLPKAVQGWLGAEPILDKWSGKKVLGIRGKAKYALDVMFPFLSEMSKMNPQPITLEEERAPYRVLSYMTGIKFAPVNLEMQRIYKTLEQMGKLGDVRKLMVNYGRALSQEELEEVMKR